ncbi:MAG: WbqC family protein [Deltaproteobacteria bacterium]|nr:WbqC family protein [Deltaproteobacteria bacterium]
MSKSFNKPKSVQNSRTIGILQPGYLPWLGFFEQVYRCDVFVLYDDVQFEKGSWRNRNRIKTSMGLQWLTVPVLLKGLDFPLIKNVVINSSVPWQKKHIKSIIQNYFKTPFFETYADGLFKIISRSWKYLVDLDIELIHWLAKQLDIKTVIRLSSDLNISGSNVQRLIDIIHALNGNCFYEGSAGENYIDVSLFERSGISVTFQDYKHPVYPQLYGEFLSHLSIIDLLFNCGSDSLKVLASS